MIRNALILGLVLLGAAPAGDSAADRVTLKDGTVVLGLVTSSTSGPRGAVEMLVRRAWAEQNAPGLLADWDRAVATSTRKAIEQRRERLAGWRREREQSPGVGPDDRILRWIDGEQTRLSDPEAAARTPLIPIRLAPGAVRQLDRRPAAAGRVLGLAWAGAVRDPESKSPDELTGAVESRGFLVDARTTAPPVSLDRLLPPAPEAEAVWLARRAATEIAVDAGLRFLRYQDSVFPDPGPGQQAPGLDPSMALSQMKRLLDPDGAANQPDPLAGKLQAVAARGRIGAVVTALTIAPDLGGVTVETTFWVRVPPGRWVAYGSRSSTVRADDLGPDEGGDLAEDPQVKAAFGMVEALGLGAIAPKLKQRSLRVGAATRKALGAARAGFNRDLDARMLPIFDPTAGATPAPAPSSTPAKSSAGKSSRPAPRRSMLGPQGG